MRKLIAQLAALAAATIVVFAGIQTAAPAFADTPGVSPTCFPQSANPHPTDPAGSTAAVLFCTPPSPGASASAASRSGGTGSGSARTNGSTTGAGTTAGGGQTSVADSTGSGTTGAAPNEGTHGRASDGYATTSGAGTPATSTDTGLFGGLVGFFSAAGGILFLFGLLALLLIVLIAVAVTAFVRRGHAKDWSSRFSRLTFRA
ncbi:MAG TPA: hypothetical protein VII89_10570 [Candidatus Dormibacteraeota bacterium]